MNFHLPVFEFRTQFGNILDMKRVRLLLALFALVFPFGISGANAVDETLTCAQGGICNLGDIGPGGGVVFYVRNEMYFPVWKNTPNAEGDLAYSADGWKYLEVAPKTWSGGKTDPKMSWCNIENTRAPWTKDLQGRDWYNKWVPGKDQSGFLASTGFGNTEIIAKNCKSGAATAARKYRGGGKTDWYLPRTTELNQLAFFAGGNFEPTSACCIKDFPKKQTATFAASAHAVNWGGPYWISSFVFGKNTNQFQGPGRMSLGSNAPSSSTPFVRPIRAF
jgi:hypothetical protein